MEKSEEEPDEAGILRTWRALDRVITAYFHERRGRADEFARSRFGVAGILRSQAGTLAGDLIRHPLNALWSLPCMAIRNAGGWLDKFGLEGAQRLVDRVPVGIRTCSQKRIEAAVIEELLGLPSHALLTEAAADPELRDLCASPEGFNLLSFQGVDVRRELSAYGSSRMAIYDLAGSLGALLGGYLFFGNGFMSPFEMSHHVSRRLSHRHVVSHFFFENGIGSIFFDIFPADPRVARFLVASVIVFLALAAFSLFAGIVADPIQAALGAHQRRIHRLLDRLEEELRTRTMHFILARARATAASSQNTMRTCIEGIAAHDRPTVPQAASCRASQPPGG